MGSRSNGLSCPMVARIPLHKLASRICTHNDVGKEHGVLAPHTEISNESGRLAITEIMTNVFRTVMATSPQDLLPIVYLAANRVAPPHEGVELGIGDAAIIKALAEATGRKEAAVKIEYKVRVQGSLGKGVKGS